VSSFGAPLSGSLSSRDWWDVEPIAPDVLFAEFDDWAWFDFDDPETIDETAGSLNTVDDKSGNGHTGTPNATIGYSADSGPNDRGYVENATGTSNTYIASSGYALTEGATISQLVVWAMSDRDPAEGGVIASDVRSTTNVAAQTGYVHAFYGAPSYYWQPATADRVVAAAASAPANDQWLSIQYHQLASASRVVVDRHSYTGAVHSLGASFDTSAVLRCCQRRSRVSTHIVVVGTLTDAQIAHYTAWALQEHGL